MGARIARPSVRFHLDDAPSSDASLLATDQIASEQVVRDIRDMSFVERALEGSVPVREC
jgi:hypothetical protein